MDLTNALVLITGGAGLVGSHIVDLLLDEDVQDIMVYDNFVRGCHANLESALPDHRLTIREGDIRDRARLAAAMDGIDIVFHQAAIQIAQCAEEPRAALEVLADGTFNVLEAAVNAGVKKVVAASCASVDGLAGSGTMYSAAKTFNEGLLRSFSEMYGLPYAALRYCNIYGPRMVIHGAYTEMLVRWMECIASAEPPLIDGDGEQTMDLVYVEDVARANMLAAKSAVTDDVFNITGGCETNLNQLVQTLLQIMGSTLRPEYGPVRRVNPVSKRLAGVQRAKALLRFEAGVSLEDGLRRLVAWWQLARKPASARGLPA